MLPFGSALTQVASVDVKDAISVTVDVFWVSDHSCSTKEKVTVRGAIVVVVGGMVVVVGGMVVVVASVVAGATVDVVVLRVGAFTVVVVFTGVDTGLATATVVVGNGAVDVVVEGTIVVDVVDISVVVDISAMVTGAASLVSSAHDLKSAKRAITPTRRTRNALATDFSLAPPSDDNHSMNVFIIAMKPSITLL